MEPASLEARLRAVESTNFGYLQLFREIVGRMALLTLAIRTPENADLDEMLQGLDELHATLARIGEFMPPVGD